MTDITTNLPEKVATAIKRAYALGQLYWQQADSDSYKQNANQGIRCRDLRTHTRDLLAVDDG